MPCYKPLKGYRSRTPNPSGKYSITFNPKFGYLDMPMTVPCGQCHGCRLERSRQWAIRCMHEAQYHKENCFVTLTMSDDYLFQVGNVKGSLVKSDFQKFMKRLRKNTGRSIRYYSCGEYGDRTGRPHYHAILFGIDFAEDRVFDRMSKSGSRVYTSPTLTESWMFYNKKTKQREPIGWINIGNVTFDSCAYVARYIMKKRNGRVGEEHYKRVLPETGELVDILPEYNSMSLKPAIGRQWYEDNKEKMYEKDKVAMNGVEFKPPRYYDGLYEIDNPNHLLFIKNERKLKQDLLADKYTPERLEVMEESSKIRYKNYCERSCV